MTTKILTPLVASALALLGASALAQAPAPSQTDASRVGDEAVLAMQQAFRKNDKQALATLLPATSGHALEPWAAYWELRNRLEEAEPAEMQAFFSRWRGSYQEDRLRNDWLLQLGKNRDWASFDQALPDFRMRDDPQVHCYALASALERGQAPADVSTQVLGHWYSQRDADDGCAHAASTLHRTGKLEAAPIWHKARLAVEVYRPRAASKAVEVVAPQAVAELNSALNAPLRYLSGAAKQSGKGKASKTPASRVAPGQQHPEIVVLALSRLAQQDRNRAAQLLQESWQARLSPAQRNWVWGMLGRQAAFALSDDALGYFSKVSRDSDLSDEMLAWKARAALRAQQWRLVGPTVDSMSPSARQNSTWVYWRARALLEGRPNQAERSHAQQLLQSIAGSTGFYEQLALEELGQPVALPPPPPPLTDDELQAARHNPGLNRALYAILLGLRSEGVREWNYTTNLHTPGGMDERQLLAAADFACRQQVWDRCINTSERTRTHIDMEQRFPMPFREAVVQRSGEIGLDPAYVYGLIRQESRFIMDARSGVGASGLMQVMPATARWTAKKIGLQGFTADQIYDRDTNILIGTAYLKLALDDFDGSLPLAAAAYNAGPGRPRNWRNGPVLDAAIWAENVPFLETRDYVKKVLANTVNYAAVLSGQPQSLKSRLGLIGPRTAAGVGNADLP